VDWHWAVVDPFHFHNGCAPLSNLLWQNVEPEIFRETGFCRCRSSGRFVVVAQSRRVSLFDIPAKEHSSVCLSRVACKFPRVLTHFRSRPLWSQLFGLNNSVWFIREQPWRHKLTKSHFIHGLDQVFIANEFTMLRGLNVVSSQRHTVGSLYLLSQLSHCRVLHLSWLLFK